MGKFTATQTILVEPENKEDVEKVWDWLNANDLLMDGEWIDIYNDSYIEGSERITGYYEPEVRYTKNGDGNPAIWELDEAMDADWLHDEILEKFGIECHVTCNLDEGYEGYYD